VCGCLEAERHHICTPTRNLCLTPRVCSLCGECREKHDLKNVLDHAHTFEGGTQRVIAKSPADAQQVKLVREHLHGIRAEFLKGDFSGPSHIHGNEMPGLAELKAAKPGEVTIAYKDVVGGAELSYRAADAKLTAALHKWFDAQLSDHGADAMAGHRHHGPGASQRP